eukprot:2863267-Karenia_brevis.AAC.1
MRQSAGSQKDHVCFAKNAMNGTLHNDGGVKSRLQRPDGDYLRRQWVAWRVDGFCCCHFLLLEHVGRGHGESQPSAISQRPPSIKLAVVHIFSVRGDAS